MDVVDFIKRRKALGRYFQDAVLRHFAFLETKYGFTCTESGLYDVKYETRNAFFAIYHDHITNELELHVGLLPHETGMFVDLGEIAKALGTDHPLLYVAQSSDEVELAVTRLADFTQNHAIKAILETIELFEQFAYEMD